MFELPITVTESDLQNDYKHVHHARSLFYLEQARLALLEAIGLSSDSYIKRGLFWVVVSISVDYKREIKGRDIIVTCENALVQEKVLVLDQRIFNERGKLAVEGTVHLMLLSQETGRSTPIPQEFEKAIARLKGKAPK